MKAIITIIFILSCRNMCFADSTGSYDYSLKKYPEITNILNDGEEYKGCGTFVDGMDRKDKIIRLEVSEDTETYLVGYIHDCEQPWIYGNVLIDKNPTGFHRSDITLPHLYQIDIDNVKYSLHQQSSEFSEDTLFVKYDVACKEGDDYLPLGICASFTSYSVSLNYKFQDKTFVLVEKLLTPNQSSE